MSNVILKAVCEAMERIAPLRLAEKWDNVRLRLSNCTSLTAQRLNQVGLLLESPVHNPARKHVLLTIDLTTPVLNESIEKGASVIVAYHPTIFKGLQSLTLSNPLQASLLRCAAEGISVYSPHTALDSVWRGVNDWLALGVAGPTSMTISGLVGEKLSPTTGESEGAEGRLVTLKEPVEMKMLESRIKSHLNLSKIQVGYPALNIRPQSIHTVAICAGSGGSMLLGKPADVYLTGEMSHHEVLASVAAGKYVVLCGHTNTERGYLPLLAQKLSDQLKDKMSEQPSLAETQVKVSEEDRHPLEFV